MSININGAPAPSAPAASQIQTVQTRQHADQAKMLDVMKDMATGKVSASDGLKKLQELLIDQAKAQASLAPGAPASAPASVSTSSSTSTSSSASGTGFSPKDTFEAGGASKPAVDLLGLAGGGASPNVDVTLDSAGASVTPATATPAAVEDMSFLDQPGGGAKPGIGSGSNTR